MDLKFIPQIGKTPQMRDAVRESHLPNLLIIMGALGACFFTAWTASNLVEAIGSLNQNQ